MNFKKKSALLCLMLVAVAGMAQSRREMKRYASNFKKMFYGSVQKAEFDERIHFVNVSNHLFIKVKIHGKEYTFGFDTGAPTLISDQLMRELNLQSIGNMSTIDANKARREQDVYQIDELQLGDVTFKNTGCIAANLDTLSDVGCIKIDGLFGVNMMRTCFWKIDMPDSMIELSSQLPDVQEGSLSLRFGEGLGGYIYLKMRTSDTTLFVEFDSGCGELLRIPESIFLRSSEYKSNHFAEGEGRTSYSLYGGTDSKEYATLTRVTIDGTPFDISIKAIPETLLLLGTQFIENREAILDWKHHMMYLAPERKKKPVTLQSTGLGFVKSGRKIRVDFLWKGSAAEKAGIKPGDQILQVNGIDVQNIQDDMYCAIKDVMEQPEVDLVIKQSTGNELTCKLVKEDLLK